MPNFEINTSVVIISGLIILNHEMKAEVPEMKKAIMRDGFGPSHSKITDAHMQANISEPTDAKMLLIMVPPTYFILKLIRWYPHEVTDHTQIITKMLIIKVGSLKKSMIEVSSSSGPGDLRAMIESSPLN